MALLVATGLVAWYAARGQDRVQDHNVQLDATSEYLVSSRADVPELGAVGEVLIPSLTRSDAGREELFRSIARTEGLTVAFFFSTTEAMDAHRAATRDQATSGALRTGFLGRLTRDEYTPGEEIYP